jgi:hypothetical protein
MAMGALYQSGDDKPYHVSVGAVLFNDKFEVCVHRCTQSMVPDRYKWLTDGLDIMYTLMRESLENDEPLEAAVHRGLAEEFGAIGEIEKYLGARIANVTTPNGFGFEKTTLYHAVRLCELGERDPEDEEGFSELVWVPVVELLGLMKEQATKTNRSELNEVEVIERFMASYDIQ